MKLMQNGKRFTQTGTITSDRLAGQMLNNKSAEEAILAMVAAKLAEKEAVKVETVEEVITLETIAEAEEKEITDLVEAVDKIVAVVENKSKVCVIANRLSKQGINRSAAFRKAWATVKAGSVETNVAGVSVGRRQEALERLTQYDASRINVSLERELNNAYDSNAITVIVSVENKGSYTIGYIPAILAKIISPLMDAGKAVTATFKEVRGKYHNYHNYGLSVAVSV